MKNPILYLGLTAACLILAGCPVINENCDEDRTGQGCSAQLSEGCMCLDQVDLNGEVWNRQTSDPSIRFPIDGRNMNHIRAEFSNYDPALGNYMLHLRADLDGDGQITADETFFSQTPDQNGLVEANFQVASALAFLHDAILEVESDGGSIINSPVCIVGPRCYIQIGGGGTTHCTADLMHWKDFEGVKDCYYAKDGQMSVGLGMVFDEMLTSPSASVPVQICSFKYLDTNTELLGTSVLSSVILGAAPVSGLLYSEGYIEFNVPVDGGIGPGNYQICVEILDAGINDQCGGASSMLIDFELVSCPDC
ncbi:MAG: hypothetical protein R3B47_00165 [Bacteroidia bacterium]